jgi:pimeloyl-ACP methyl ester carboxylesterase
VELAARGLVFPALSAGPEDSPGVLLLHGFPLLNREWTAQLSALGGAGYRAVAPLQRGYAPTNRPDAVAAYEMDELVADVVGLLDALHWERAHLVGHDWGGAVAWHVAGRHPERVRSLTAVSTPHPLAHSEALESGGPQVAMSDYIGLFRQPGAIAEDELLADDCAWLRRFLIDAPDPATQLAAFSDRAMLTATLNWYRAMRRRDGERTGRIRVPTLYVWGEQDHTLGREAADKTAELVDGPYRFVPVAGVGHWLPEEAPEILIALLLEHLETHSSR